MIELVGGGGGVKFKRENVTPTLSKALNPYIH